CDRDRRHRCISGPMVRSHAPSVFSYTTLFRSTSKCFQLTPSKPPPPPPPRASRSPSPPVFDSPPPPASALTHSRNRPTTRVRFQDRKSTRLNSSHDQISYAVVCLKKKTTKSNI